MPPPVLDGTKAAGYTTMGHSREMDIGADAIVATQSGKSYRN